MTRQRRTAATRAASLVALVVVVAALAVLILHGGDSSYTVHAHFVNGGQLVQGDLVEVGGQNVGVVTELKLTGDSQADVVLRIDDDRFTPLRQGTVARIRAVGLSGVANRFVELEPAGGGDRINPGGVIPTRDTRPIVDLDEVLDSLDPRARRDIQKLLHAGAITVAGVAPQINRALTYLSPAINGSASLAAEVARDEPALSDLITSSARVSGALASRQQDLADGIGHTAVTLSALSGERAALGDAIARAPAALRSTARRLDALRATISSVGDTLRAARPAAAPLSRVLRLLVPAASEAEPVLAQLRAQLPDLQRTLSQTPSLANVALPALTSTTSTLKAALPVAAGLRPYTPDATTGLLLALGGSESASYDANGHYTRISANASPSTSLGSLGGLLPLPKIGPLDLKARTGLTARCPGAATQPAADKSNPYIPDASLCDQAQNPK